MLRNRSRTMVMKHEQQPLMADHQTLVPTKQNPDTKPLIKTFLSSPRFKAFTTKISDEPTNLIITRYQPPPPPLMMIFPFNSNKNPTLNSKQSSKDEKYKHSWDGCKRIGLALADDTNEYKNTIFEDHNDDEKIMLFGTNLKVQPFISTERQSDHYHQDEFRAKPVENSCIMLEGLGSAGVQTEEEEEEGGCNGFDGMELSEDYTCVIFHGDNPKTTHFFDNCSLESYCCLSDEYSMSATKDDDHHFLSFCYTCKNKLHQKDDIYIYRGEKAFCSCECRYEEILLDGDDI